MYILRDARQGSFVENDSLLHFPLTSLPVRDVSGFGHNLNAYLVRGTSMWIHVSPTDASPHYGRWATLLAKSFNSLRCPQIASRTKSGDGTEGIGISTIFLPALRRHAVLGRSWVRDMLMAALGSASSPCMQKVGMPRLLFWDDIEGLTTEWIMFERLVMVSNEVVENDLQDGTAIFPSPETSETFREAVLRQNNIATPFTVQLRPKPIITLLLSADDAAGFSNNGEILSALRSVAGTTYSVRPYSATLDAPLASFASVMRNTHILIARHGERLANALFMPTNATVIEIAPYGCEEGETSRLYSNLFKNTHVRHLVWRAPMDGMQYRSWADARYAEWTASECAASVDCQEARSSAAVYVDTERLIDLVHESMNPRHHPWRDT